MLVTIVLALGLLTRVVAPRLLAGVAATAVLKGVFGAGLALLASLFFAASILGRVSKKPAIVRLLVRAGHLELQTEGGRFPIAPRTIPRVSNEMARVVMATRGGDGQPATWRIEYGGGTGEYYELVTIAAHEKPIALEHAAARTRGALATLPFEA